MNAPVPPDRITREETIFNAAVELSDPAKRAAYLELACDGDAALRARLEKMLAADGDSFFEKPLPAQSLGDAATLAASSSPGAEPLAVSEHIGRYKLLQKIGEGGCGVVYMAEQSEPVRRHVALKVIKLGMDTKSVIARFESERQALALMDHPNIARVLDGGETEAGRPYFVMELVRGVKITEYCDEAKLSTRDRLELFVNVCHAIQHAHQKGIIHRDIKPSNILVTVNDGAPLAKVIDFGIAKATGGRLTNQTLFTACDQFIGTPAYMSPEQTAMTSADIDTRSDIYSLGVLLYELLIGQTPFDAKELLASGLDELRRTIREDEPVRPSTRLRTMLAAELSTTAQRRRTEAPRLVHLLRGDLDWVVMKTLEKDRSRRYETANGLAMDIQRHLNYEPVAARPPSNLYRFQKLLLRNKLVFAATVIIMSVLVAAAYYGQRQARLTKKANAQLLISQAESLFVQNKASAGLAYLARVLRDNPKNRVAAERIMSALSQRKFILPSADVLVAEAAIKLLRISRDGQRIATTLEAGTARIWDIGSGQPVGKPLRHDKAILDLEFSPDTRCVATASYDGTARVWNAQTGQPVSPPLKHKDAVRSARFSANAQMLVTTSDDRTAQLWDAQTGRPLLPQPLVHGGVVQGAEFSGDGQRVVTYSLDHTAQVWDVRTGQRLFEPLRHESEVKSAQFNSDASRLITVSWENRPRLWDMRTGRELLPDAFRHAQSVTAAQFSPDGHKIVTTSLDRTAQIWEANTGQRLGEPLQHGDQVRLAQFSRDGGLLLTLTESKGLRLWDTFTFQPLVETIRHPFDTFQLTPDGQRLLTVSSNIVRRWNLRIPLPRPRPVTQHRTSAITVFSPDHKLKVDDSSDENCVKVLRAETGEPLTGSLCHAQRITSKVFSPDSERLLTASEDKTVRVWDALTGQPLTEPLQFDLAVSSAQFFEQNSGKIVAVLSDKTAWLYEVPTATTRIPLWLPELAEAVAGQRLDRHYIEQKVSANELHALIQKLAAALPSDRYTTWAQQLLAERTQPGAPESEPHPSP